MSHRVLARPYKDQAPQALAGTGYDADLADKVRNALELRGSLE